MQADFDGQAQRAVEEPGDGHLLPIIRKELLHYEILFALDRANLLRGLTFQGGTALRLCYGAPRLSEDLDFSGGPEFSAESLQGAKEAVERRIRERFGVEAVVKEPRRKRIMSGVTVHRWWLVMKLPGARPDVPHLRVRLEVANVPAYSREVCALHANYDFLPDGYNNLLIAAESRDEVMADKLVSLVASGVDRVRHRDIWDLRWLKQRGAVVRVDWVERKLRDYGAGDYLAGLDAMHGRLPEFTCSEEFREVMSAYLPKETRRNTLEKEEFLQFLAGEVQDLLGQVRVGLDAWS